MRTHVSVRDLQAALKTVRPAVQRTATVNHALASVRLDTDPERVRLTTTDLEMGIHTWIPTLPGPQPPHRGPEPTAAPAGRPAARRRFGSRRRGGGTAIVAFDALERFLRTGRSNDAAVTLVSTADGLQVAAERRSVVLPSVDPTDWPREFPHRPMTLITADSVTLREWWKRLALVCSTDEARPVLTGLGVRVRDCHLVASATDTYRLHILTSPDTASAPRELDVIFPPSALKAALAVSRAERHAPLSMWVDDRSAMVEFRTPRSAVRVRTIEGEFPPVTALVPDIGELYECELVGVQDAKAAAGILEEIAKLVRLRTPVRLEFAPDGTVRTWVNQTGELRIDGDHLPGLTVQPPQTQLDIQPRLFNLHYLAEAIRAAGDGGTLYLRPDDPGRSVFFWNEAFTALVMPAESR